MDVNKRKESALKAVIVLIALICIILAIFGISLLRDAAPADVTGARYVLSRQCEANEQ